MFCLGLLLGAPGQRAVAASADSGAKKVYIIPIREEIASPLVYLVRRGVKDAMEARADLIVLDMDTNGGRIDIPEELIEILNQFKGQTVTYVNRKAFSAGAFIAVATQKIFMAPQSVIGAAAPMMMIPGGGPAQLPETVEAKMNSAVRALVRANAEKNGYNVAVIEAMIDKTKHLEIDGEVLNEKGQILTLTNLQAEKDYGQPPTPLLSSGTAESMDALLTRLDYGGAQRVFIKPTGVEKVGTWINMISPLLLIIGAVGLYIEFKTPGFGFPGIAGISAFVIYFFGGYIAGLSGAEWILLFAVGLVLIAVELFVLPGHTIAGIAGACCIVAAIVMAMVDVYPITPGTPGLSVPPVRFRIPVAEIVTNLSLALAGSLAAAWLLSRILPKTSLYGTLVSHSASGEAVIQAQEREQQGRLGEVGVAASVLRPGGKAQFGDEIIDVISEGDLIAKGSRVKVIGHSGREAIVAAV